MLVSRDKQWTKYTSVFTVIHPNMMIFVQPLIQESRSTPQGSKQPLGLWGCLWHCARCWKIAVSKALLMSLTPTALWSFVRVFESTCCNTLNPCHVVIPLTYIHDNTYMQYVCCVYTWHPWHIFNGFENILEKSRKSGKIVLGKAWVPWLVSDFVFVQKNISATLNMLTNMSTSEPGLAATVPEIFQ